MALPSVLVYGSGQTTLKNALQGLKKYPRTVSFSWWQTFDILEREVYVHTVVKVNTVILLYDVMGFLELKYLNTTLKIEDKESLCKTYKWSLFSKLLVLGWDKP